ncbi:hypothetical protein [Lentzea sp. NPDC003310]|uniref:hypothetical protein n=1 Tax=Lentzea sp. NPDC003310 TaxID=3154447 RepID=UPI0033AB706E
MAKLGRDVHDRELLQLQTELVKLQEWVKATGARIVALAAPSERERTQWYFQRYVAHLPAAGEIVLLDRSWYNRAGVERVMGYCTPQEHELFLRQCPRFERMLVEDGVLLRKYWFSVSDAEQERRFRKRLDDPLKRWKLSPMDLESLTRWEATAPKIKLPTRPPSSGYQRTAPALQREVPGHAAKLA